MICCVRRRTTHGTTSRTSGQLSVGDGLSNSHSFALSLSKMEKKLVKYYVCRCVHGLAVQGKPAAICLVEEERDDEWLQAVVTEFNLSETYYLTRIIDFDSETQDSSLTASNPWFSLRWFTPVAKPGHEIHVGLRVQLFGHATLAASHFLFTSGLVNANKIEFPTLSGVLTTKRVPVSQDCFLIELDFPVVPLVDFDSDEVSSVSKALSGASVIDLKMTTTEKDLFCFVLPLGKAVADLQPQFDEIQRCPGLGVIITGLAPLGSGFDFFSRCFFPKSGIKENYHHSIPSRWQTEPAFDEKSQRVLLRGKAVTVMDGSLLV
ncbi:unnamed protein product [Camellia sinensis]